MISWEYSPSSAQCSLPVVWVSPQASVGHEVVQHALQGVGVLLERQNVLGIGRTTDNVNVLVYTMLLLCSYLMSITRLSLFDVDKVLTKSQAYHDLHCAFFVVVLTRRASTIAFSFQDATIHPYNRICSFALRRNLFWRQDDYAHV